MTRKIAHPQLKYSLMSALYWIAVCAAAGFTSALMVSKGYSNSTIGLTIAASNVLMMLFQPVVAAAIDKYSRLSLQFVIIMFTLLCIVFSAILLILPAADLLMAIVITGVVAFINILQPFVNAVSVELEDAGCKMNFGLCRAFGSFGYAVVSTIMGFLIVQYSEMVIPVTGITCCILFIVSTLPFCNLHAARTTDAELTADSATQEEQNTLSKPVSAPAAQADVSKQAVVSIQDSAPAAQSLGAFMFSNKRFLLFLLSVACLFTSHCFTTSYLYQIACDVGGDSSSMGIAGAIAAMLELPGMMLFSYFLTKASCRTLLRISGIGFFLRFLCFFLADSVPALYLAQFPQAISYAIFIPASVHYVSRLFSKTDMAKAQSLVTTATTIGGIIASVAGGRLIDMAGVHFSELCITILGGIGALILFFSAEDVSGR